eukprot:TRINITY_DN71305_c0_g1_i1.p1 TRINITY_DN71305_c0_g1~~TRINITY_DN71305_c0_g1_i1.p1  ORF type:complete len:368 (+),score=132.74 TRINITY_DN71305_c0_g1_i1:92-1105(+)
MSVRDTVWGAVLVKADGAFGPRINEVLHLCLRQRGAAADEASQQCFAILIEVIVERHSVPQRSRALKLLKALLEADCSGNWQKRVADAATGLPQALRDMTMDKKDVCRTGVGGGAGRVPGVPHDGLAALAGEVLSVLARPPSARPAHYRVSGSGSEQLQGKAETGGGPSASDKIRDWAAGATSMLPQCLQYKGVLRILANDAVRADGWQHALIDEMLQENTVTAATKELMQWLEGHSAETETICSLLTQRLLQCCLRPAKGKAERDVSLALDAISCMIPKPHFKQQLQSVGLRGALERTKRAGRSGQLFLGGEIETRADTLQRELIRAVPPMLAAAP